MFSTLTEIFGGIVLPALALVAVGAILQRTRALDLNTLVKLNLFGFVPGFLLVRVAESQFAWSTIGLIGVAVLGPMLFLALACRPLFRITGASRVTSSTAIAGALFFNAGNFGIPVAQLAFGNEGGQVQAVIVLFLNTIIFFAGYLLLASAGGGIRASVRSYLRLPMLYVIALGFLIRASGLVADRPPPWLSWIWTAAHFMADGMIPIALITLGAQMAHRPVWPRWRVTGPVVVIKLIVLPAVTAGFVWFFKLWPWPGAQLILASAGPTAINTLLLTMEVEGDVDAVAGIVFWTTIFCALTVTPLLMLLRLVGGTALPSP